MATVTERYTPFNLAANATFNFSNQSVGGFLAKTDGTITITAQPSGKVLVDAIPVTSGVYTPIPGYVGASGGRAVLAGGASGTIFI